MTTKPDEDKKPETKECCRCGEDITDEQDQYKLSMRGTFCGECYFGLSMRIRSE